MADMSLPFEHNDGADLIFNSGGGFVKRKVVAVISILVIIAFLLTIIAPLFQ
jgi:hypothetical protein